MSDTPSQYALFDALIAQTKALPPLPTAVVCPHSDDALAGALYAAKEEVIRPLLIGDRGLIEATAEKSGASIDGLELFDCQGDQAAAEACTLVNEGKAGAVMKGHLHTDDFLKPMLAKGTGLRTGRRFTHVFVFDVPGRDELLMVSDAVVNITPDLLTKQDICQNAIDLATSLGMEARVGVLSAVETVLPAMTSSTDAALLSKMADRGQITGGLVEGPLAMDNAISVEAARTKGLTGEVAGRANILVVPNIEAGNILSKQLVYMSKAEMAGVVLGAKTPVLLNSRSDSPTARLASCAVAVLQQSG